MAEKTVSKFRLIKDFQEKRNENSEKYSRLNMFLVLFFPFFISSMAEINQFQKVGAFLGFVAERPTIVIFDVIVAAVVFIFLWAIIHRAWIATAVQSFVYMALSITELFKYGTNGNHLILSDMKLFRSVKSLR